MTDIDALVQRIEALEELAAFQERTIEDLSTTVTDQWKQLEALRRELANLGAQMQEIEAATSAPPATEPPPPHY